MSQAHDFLERYIDRPLDFDLELLQAACTTWENVLGIAWDSEEQPRY
jgi:hypothetical protein